MQRLNVLSLFPIVKPYTRALYAAAFSLTLLITAPLTHAQTITGGGHQWEKLPALGQDQVEYFIQIDNIRTNNENQNWRHATMLIHPTKADPSIPYRSMLITFTIDCPTRTKRSDTATIYKESYGAGNVVQTQKGVGVFEANFSDTENTFVDRTCK